MKKLADGKPWTMPATIDAPAILDEIGRALKRKGRRRVNDLRIRLMRSSSSAMSALGH
jgi:hypothetical protein